MSCPVSKTLKQFMDQQGNTMGLDMECSKRPGLFSMVLKHIWPSIYFLPGMERSFQLTVADTTFTLPNNEKLYKIEGFYGKGTKLCSDNYETLDDSCTEMCGCMPGYNRLIMTEMRGVPEVFSCQYNVPCIGSTTVTYNLPPNTEFAYVRYFVRYPDLTDENSTLGLPEYLEPALQAILKYYTLHNGGSEQGDDQRFLTDFNAFVKQQIEIFAPNVPRLLAVKLVP